MRLLTRLILTGRSPHPLSPRPWEGTKRERRWKRPSVDQSVRSLRIADPVNRTGIVIGDQNRAVLGKQNVIRAPVIFALRVDPTRGENILLGVLAVWIDRDANDATTLELVTVPRTVLGDEDIVLVFRRELVASVELHAKRSHMRAKLIGRGRELRTLVPHGEFRIRNIALMAIRIAE